MSLTIQLKIKFRAFGFTIGSLAKQAYVSLGVNGIQFSLVPVGSTPSSAHIVVDERGVLLAVW